MTSRLEHLLTETNETVFTAEFPSLDGNGMAKAEKMADRMRGWFDGVNATDNPAAHAHVSNVASAIAMKNLGLEPIMQVVCRDKNRIAQQADIIGASMFGIENFVALTGDDVTAGDEPEARRVFDLDGPQLVRLMDTMRRGQYMSGRKLDPAPHMFIGAVENPGAPPFDYRVQRVAKKVGAGAKYLQLQICYHADRLEKFAAGVAAAGLDRHVSLIPTIVLVKGARPLKFMHDQVPGIDVPADLIAEVEGASDPAEAAYQQTLRLAKHALEQPGVRGLHVTDFRHDDTLDRLMTDLGRVRRTS
jgi:methylenetetrahydrofolate reductase (NADPH)